MTKYKIILISFVCFSVAVLAGQRPLDMPPNIPPRKPGMTSEEYRKEIEKAFEQQKRQQEKQQRENEKEYMDFLTRQAWLRLLRVPERQWMLIEPKYEKVGSLIGQSCVGATSGVRNMESFHWNRPLKSYYGQIGRAHV